MRVHRRLKVLSSSERVSDPDHVQPSPWPYHSSGPGGCCREIPCLLLSSCAQCSQVGPGCQHFFQSFFTSVSL
ncbi:hypothetical protein PssvBMR7_gp60 [Pseudomonas phage MR7]|nr:hypothetical protein PssvBMR7_gp60 [Pseudomonas phage MR7]